MEVVVCEAYIEWEKTKLSRRSWLEFSRSAANFVRTRSRVSHFWTCDVRTNFEWHSNRSIMWSSRSNRHRMNLQMELCLILCSVGMQPGQQPKYSGTRHKISFEQTWSCSNEIFNFLVFHSFSSKNALTQP